MKVAEEEQREALDSLALRATAGERSALFARTGSSEKAATAAE
jgi:hypothetical protein